MELCGKLCGLLLQSGLYGIGGIVASFLDGGLHAGKLWMTLLLRGFG